METIVFPRGGDTARVIRAKDIDLVQISSEYPEQYEAYTPNRKKVGYIHVRRGWCIAWYPDEDSDNEIYSAELKHGWWSFGSAKERKVHLRRIKAVIALWVNQVGN